VMWFSMRVALLGLLAKPSSARSTSSVASSPIGKPFENLRQSYPHIRTFVHKFIHMPTYLIKFMLGAWRCSLMASCNSIEVRRGIMYQSFAYVH
jgi:hypothetical protein